MKRVSIHILLWTLYLTQDTAFAYLADAGVLSHFSTSARIAIALKVCVGLLLPKIVLVYFLVYVMLERIIKQREKLTLNIFYTVLVFIVTLLIYRVLEVYIIYPFTYQGIRPAGNYFNAVSFLFGLMDLGFVSGTAIAIKVISLQLIAKEKEKLLIKDKLETELKFLKNQTNPHFLFNTLNNIYALARKKSDSTADVVMKLSKILRFMLYESGKEHITVGEEVKLIEDYIDLEKLRYNERLNIVFKKVISNESQIVSPLLLLPFVENAFKHGASENRFNSFIHIELHMNDEQLQFSIENNKDADKMKQENCESIGLVNIRRQLELLYGDYNMKVENTKDTFKVILHVNLKSYGKV